jgi:tRNA-uridine 2-sulfurtransferase
MGDEPQEKTVLCAMSGGVDSSVTAYLLVQAGYRVIGITMKTWARDQKSAQKSCCGIDDVEDARRVAGMLSIPYIALDMEQVFRETVIHNFRQEYRAGRTPNPCIVCNYKLKFGYLMDKADELGADYVATGHYARVELREGRYCIRRGLDPDKDQSYVLYNLTQKQLARTLLPLAEFKKNKIREIAAREGFERVAWKPDSQEICFVPDDYRNFLKKVDGDNMQQGSLVDRTGKELATHDGVQMFTIGQRKGLGVSLPYKAYVTDIDSESRTVKIGMREDLQRKEMIVQRVNWVSRDPGTREFPCYVKIRYQHDPVEATVFPCDEDSVRVIFGEAQEAVAPGQSAVFYDGDHVLGGGVIERCC